MKAMWMLLFLLLPLLALAYIGSPTHMLVYSPGGYRFSDFMRIGLLMNLIILAANILIVNILYPLA